uniref:G-protein coupled receptors family 3 profile domain-containing protein n=1 Tax=Corethron hystrix TaxID=216773 RepID=A0A7S1FPG6_9STRA|mmetsp:Transcript_2076/g.4161  ORF Transcript_2076/g.4161 Transcript_2076/m.4161 type:complete len:658 (+) Transcript_2076:993-2966(+)
MNFYNSEDNFEFGSRKNGDMYDVLAVSAKHGSCKKAQQDQEKYTSCAHVSPEVWHESFGSQHKKEYFSTGLIDPPTYLGVISQQGFFIPKFTAESDSTLDSYFGLKDEKNKNKLAESFLRPITWIEYCTKISENNCTADDGIARKYPEKDDYGKFFVKDLYIGYFNATIENDCNNNPECTGHFVDYPNSWRSFAVPQMYHHNISLKSSGSEYITNGYSYSQMTEIWQAANATKSNVLMLSWDLGRSYMQFLGTESEYIKVYMPSATQECLDSRISVEDRVSEDFNKRVGEKAGACDFKFVKRLSKLLSSALHSDPDFPEAMQSPAYKAIQLLKLDRENYVDIDKKTDTSTPREAVCQWMIDNYNVVQKMIPSTYPRTKKSTKNNPWLYYGALVVGCIATFGAMVMGVLVFQQREKKLARKKPVEIEFLFLILAGLFFTSIASVLSSLPVTDILCVAKPWFLVIGGTLQLVPLIVKIGTIVKVLNAAKKCRRIHVNRTWLHGTVLMISLLSVIFLTLVSIIDKPLKTTHYNLVEGDTMVTDLVFCSSKSLVWEYVACGCVALLLVCTTVLASQIHIAKKNFVAMHDIDESIPLAVMTYSHFIFMVLYIATLPEYENKNYVVISYLQSYIHSCDALAILAIYFAPKIFLESHSESRNKY